MKKISLLFVLASSLSAFIISAGGFDVQKYVSNYSFHNDTLPKTYTVNITEVLAKDSPNTNGVTMWITREWNEKWYDAKTIQKEIINKGYTPVFIFYYFADDVSVEYVKKTKADYFKHLEKFTKFLKTLRGQKIVILNPEYNMDGAGKWEGMNDIFLQSFKIVRKDPQTLVGPCVGDFGNYDKTNEPKEWVLFDPSLKKAATKADFIAFQEMRALTRNKTSHILKTPKRAYNLAKYLKAKYKKPTMLAYLAISTFGKGGDALQKKVYKGFVKYLPKMKQEGDLLLFGIFHYFDYPGHTGYFKKGEPFFGVRRKDGTFKPSFRYYNQLH